MEDKLNIKIYQVVDTIHGTIYYTNLEKQIINTPFFNRLHDVNQSSTVYLTFPPNRTKRYEHSLGTMQLASEMFCNAAMNSSGSEAMDLLMKEANKAFFDIVSYIKSGDGNSKFIFSFQQETYKTMDFLKNKDDNYIISIINDKFTTLFHGNFLLNYAPNMLNIGINAFLFLCLLQSIRIVGLLHDIGHPPQSHIIESVLEEIDYEVRGHEENERNIRQKNFINILSSYKDINHRNINQIDNNMAIKTVNAKKEHLHEMIGVQIIKQVIDYVFPKFMDKNIKNAHSDEGLINMLYYFTIIEFVFSIVRNKNKFWIGLHNIIDGTIDADRLDFVPRDSQNSGMVWGKIPYRRLINTVRFGIVSEDNLDSSVYICFSDKNIQQMDDLLNSRFKIFSMINYHHRSTKIAALYKQVVKMLADEYLCSSEPDTKETAYFSNISGLWRALEIVYSKESSVLNLIQWNDSWLNGLLYRHMVEESINESRSNKLEYLREVFLNEKHHYSLIKRQTEMLEINNAVRQTIAKLIEKIEKELKTIQDEKMYLFLADIYNALTKFDWAAIEMNLGMELVSNAVREIMETEEYKKIVKSHIIEAVKFSLGITGNTYVYDSKGEEKSYYTYSNIKDVLYEERLGFPFYYIYINIEDETKENSTLLSDIRKSIGVEIGNKIIESVESLISFE